MAANRLDCLNDHPDPIRELEKIPPDLIMLTASHARL